jgi:hypothetical protein
MFYKTSTHQTTVWACGHRLLTTEAPGPIQVSFMLDKAALERDSLQFYQLVIIPPLLHIYLQVSQEIYNSPEQAVHSNTVCPKVGVSFLASTLLVLTERNHLYNH